MFRLLALLLVVAPPHFHGGPGWHVGSHGHWGWAPTVRYRDCPITGGAEGFPRHVSFNEWFIRNRGVEHYLYVWFGRVHPTRRQLARANGELRTAG